MGLWERNQEVITVGIEGDTKQPNQQKFPALLNMYICILFKNSFPAWYMRFTNLTNRDYQGLGFRYRYETSTLETFRIEISLLFRKTRKKVAMGVVIIPQSPSGPEILSCSIELDRPEIEQTIIKLKTLMSRIGQYRRDQQQVQSLTSQVAGISLGKGNTKPGSIESLF